MIFNYKGPRSLGARGCRSATQESLRSTALHRPSVHPRYLGLLRGVLSPTPALKNRFQVLVKGAGRGSSLCLFLKKFQHFQKIIPSIKGEQKGKGVQYVKWVMHKCIMVKVGGKRNTRKVCTKKVNFSKTGGGNLSK